MEQEICQSCGMPLSDGVFGTSADGTTNREYCCYCFKEGRFEQDCTMDEMILHCVQFLDEFNKDAGTRMTREEAIAGMRAYFPQLRRWKEAGTGK